MQFTKSRGDVGPSFSHEGLIRQKS